jgi:hypothetical protein
VLVRTPHLWLSPHVWLISSCPQAHPGNQTPRVRWRPGRAARFQSHVGLDKDGQTVKVYRLSLNKAPSSIQAVNTQGQMESKAGACAIVGSSIPAHGYGGMRAQQWLCWMLLYTAGCMQGFPMSQPRAAQGILSPQWLHLLQPKPRAPGCGLQIQYLFPGMWWSWCVLLSLLQLWITCK